MFFDLIEEVLVNDLELGLQAKSNPIENFSFGFIDKYMDASINRMEQNQDIFAKMMNDKEFGSIVQNYLMKKVYNRLSK